MSSKNSPETTAPNRTDAGGRPVRDPTAKMRLTLRNEEAERVVDALRWYADGDVAPRTQAQCTRIAEMVEEGFE